MAMSRPHGVLAVSGQGGQGALAVQGGGLKVGVCGRLLDISPEASVSLPLLSRELASQLKISGPASLQLSDAMGARITSSEDLAGAVREGRHPLQAALTVTALREIEQKKAEVENKKEELTQFQWQVVVDQMAMMSQEVASMSLRLQGVKDECLEALQRYREDEVVQRDQAASALARESAEREATLRDADAKIDRVVQMMYSERSARDVADHQLAKQLEMIQTCFESERGTRAREHAETSRVLEAMRHDLDTELEKNAAIWNQHLDMVKRLDVLVSEQATSELSNQHRLTSLESETEKVRSTVAALESAIAAQHRAMQEDMHRRGEETIRAVRNEVKARENEQRHFAKDLETSWKSLEAKMMRVSEQTGEGNTSMAERARVLEQRCCDLEQLFMDSSEQRSYKEQSLSDKVGVAVNMADSVDLAQKAQDVLLQNTISKVEDLVQRISTAEGDLHKKAHSDFWRPQMEAFQRVMERHEGKMTSLEKEMNSRFAQETAHRDVAKVQMQENMKTCMEKVGSKAGYPQSKDGRFIEINQNGPATGSATAVGPGGVAMQVITPPISQSVSRQISQSAIQIQSPRILTPASGSALLAGGAQVPQTMNMTQLRVTSPCGARFRGVSPSAEGQR
mmetsp:Transcript_67127/g.172861  ORF Transcript_67127/g.172861 Transcript_67127/m.172861 type:complete len:626 (+) Transcript_67127:65-1942(+)